MNLKRKKLFIGFLSIFLLGIFSPVFALQLDWPAIGGISLREGASMAEFTMYFFSLAIAVGAAIMFYVFFKSGFNLLTGSGSPSIFAKAKTQMIGAAIGLVILLGAYAGLTEINKNIMKTEDPNINCINGFERKLKLTETNKKTGKQKEYVYTNCIQGDNPDIELKEGEEVLEEKNSFEKCSVREIITYTEKNFKGEKNVIFKDDTTNNEDCPEVKDIEFGEETRSIRIIPKLSGMYLYDDIEIEDMGTCGTAAKTYLSSDTAFSGNFCDTGTADPSNPAFPNQGSSTTWICQGRNGEANTTCTASRLSDTTSINGDCGSANGQSFTSKPTENLCSTGNASSVSGSGPWTWTCSGLNGGTVSFCSANKDSAAADDGERETYLLSPYFIKENVDNFNDLKINDKIDRVEFVNIELTDKATNGVYGKYYGAIMFTEPKLRGNCAYVANIHLSLQRTDVATGKDIDFRDDGSSAIVFESTLTRDIDKGLGNIIFYAVPNCQDNEENSTIVDAGKYDKCIVPISTAFSTFEQLEQKIGIATGVSFICGGKFLTDEARRKINNGGDPKTDAEYFPIQSFKIDGPAGVVIKSESGQCHYYTLKDSERRGNCITNLQDVFSSWLGGDKPETIMIVPLTQ